VADTWIDLKYRDVEGESNRSLRIVKARGTAHSKQLRELLLSDQGITLADVYFDGSAVLMGTARLQREADLKAAEARTAFELAQKRLRLEQAKSAINNKMEMLMHELADQDAQLAHLQAEEAQRLASAQWLSERVAAARGRDESSGR
jgi:circadian clock protein KaiC